MTTDKCRVRMAKYRQEHKDEIREKNRKWRLRNPDKHRRHAKLYRQRHPDKVRQINRSYYSRNKDKFKEYGRISHLKVKYGISRDEFLKIWEIQKELCALCLRPISGKIHVDHCHKTGKFRGLVHHKCNTLLGMADDDLVVLKRAVEYIERFEDVIRIEESKEIK